MKTETQTYPDLCVCCGEPVPEGRMICYACEMEDQAMAPCAPTCPAENTEKAPGQKEEKANASRD